MVVNLGEEAVLTRRDDKRLGYDHSLGSPAGTLYLLDEVNCVR